MIDAATYVIPEGAPREVIEGVEYWYDDAEAQRFIDFCALFLRHTKGRFKGKPLYLEPWEENFCRALFGWLHYDENGDVVRRYRTAFLFVPRKNGKSTLAAAIAIYLLFADGEPGAEVYGAAGDTEQARIVFKQAKAMIREARDLRTLCQVFKDSVAVPETLSSYQVLSSAPETKHGFNAHGVVFDELHTQPDRELWDVLTTSQGSRSQPVTFVITTAGFDKHSICYEVYNRAKRIGMGEIVDPTWLVAIYEAGEDDDWRDEETWKKANPNIGVSINLSYLRSQFRLALDSPQFENTFKRLHLNIWTEQAVRWLRMDTWDACAGDVADHILLGRKCWGGLDLSTKIDLTSLVLAFPYRPKDDPKAPLRYVLRCWAWLPEATVELRARRDKVPYDVWAAERLVEVTPGSAVDYSAIRRTLNRIAKVYDLQEVGFDPHNASSLVQDLADRDGLPMIEIPQTYKHMSEPTKMFEALVIEGLLLHGGHPVMRWAARNVAVVGDARENLIPHKTKSFERIDPIVAGIMALGRATLGKSGPRKSSVINERGELLSL